MSRVRAEVLAALGPLLLAVAACGGDLGAGVGGPPSGGGAGVGEVCGPAQPCQGALLCLDGLCRDRELALWAGPERDAGHLDLPWPPQDGAASTDAPVAGRDGERGDGDGAAPDAADPGDPGDSGEPGDGGGPGLADGSAAVDVADGAASADLPDADASAAVDALDALSDPGAPPDPGSLPDAPLDAAPAPDPGSEEIPAGDAATEDIGPSDAGGDGGPVTLLLMLGDDEAETSPASESLVLQQGQAWAVSVQVPLPGRLIALRVVARDAFVGESCAFFRPALWLAGPDGTFADEPDWWAPSTKAVQGLEAPQLVWVDEPVDVPAGAARVGLELDGACLGEPPAPVLVADTTGDPAESWLWAPQPAASPWVPAAFAKIPGRWGLRVLVEVTLP